MRTNWDTFRDGRQQVLNDLQSVSRRANGIAPVVDPEDIGIIRNIIRPALDMGKFGEGGMAFIQSSPYVNAMELSKQAGFMSDWGDAAWAGLKDIGSGLADVGVGLGKTVAAPYYAIRGGIDNGWRGALGGLVSGPVQFAEGLSGVGRGVASQIPGARDYGVDLPYLGRVSAADVAGELAPWLIPGGVVSGLGRMAKLPAAMSYLAEPSRLAKYVGYAGKGAPMLGNIGGIAGGIQHGLEARRAATAPAVAEAPKSDQSAALDEFKTQLSQLTRQQNQEVVPPAGHLSAGWLDIPRRT